MKVVRLAGNGRAGSDTTRKGCESCDVLVLGVRVGIEVVFE